MSAQIRFSVKGFVTPAEAEALKHGLKEAIRQIEQGQAIQQEYKMPDIPTASLITLAFRNGQKAYFESMQSLKEKIDAGTPEPGANNREPDTRG